MATRKRRRPSRWTLRENIRELVLFVIGLGGLIYEMVVEHRDRPILLALLATMVGLPFFSRIDDLLTRGDHHERDRRDEDEDCE